MLDALELQEQLVGMAIGPAAELPAIVRLSTVLIVMPCASKVGSDVGVEQMHRGERHLVGVEPAPGKREQQSIAVCR